MSPRSPRRARQLPAPPAGLPGPDAVQVGPRDVRVGTTWCRTMAVVGYPREVGAAWLEPLLAYPGSVDVSLHVEPVPSMLAAQRLKRQLARLESSRRLAADRGRLEDFEVEAAADDARDLAGRLARGQGRLFRVGLYLTVRADSPDQLEAETARLVALLGSMLLDAQPATYRSFQGWVSTLPLGLDLLRLRRTFDTDSLAAAMPFASAELPQAQGVLLGRNLRSQGLVLWDRWRQDNYNSVVLARSGAGKSYATKLELLRWLYVGVEAAVIDPHDEYRRLAEAIGGTHIALGNPSGRLNPFDLGPTPTPDALTSRALFLHTLVSVLLGQPLDPAATAALDRAILAAYRARGITTDPRTHARPAPLLADLAAALHADKRDAVAPALAARLAPFTSGTHRRLFDGPTSSAPEGHLIVFGLRELPDELTAVGMLLALDRTWRRVADPTRPGRRLVVVDEAWQLMQQPAGARWLYRLAKAGRKHWCGLTVVTQDVADLLGSDLGQAVVSNAATQILLAQAPQAIGPIADAFGLSEGERAFLVTARRGEGLLTAGTHRVAFHAEASSIEHRLATTDPEFLASLKRLGENPEAEVDES
jgi:type IV secretory pathway VirB4 component